METTLEVRSTHAVRSSALAGLSDTERRVERLIERLKPRYAAEQRFRHAGGKVKTKSFFRRHEKRFVAPVLKTAFKTLGLYEPGLREALTPVVSKLELRFSNLPQAFDGFRILHLSDLHIDCVEGLKDSLLPILDHLQADICLITGDYRFEDEGPSDEVFSAMRELLPRIQAEQGVVGILGNHDDADIALELERMGIRMLVNDAVALDRNGESIWIAGTDDDFDYKCDDLTLAMSEIPGNAFTVLMAHSPDLYREAVEARVDLYLCGHTHGGQVRFPGIGALRSNGRCPRKYTYRYWKHEQMHGYTSGGIGCSSLPVRLNCPPELVLITMRSDQPGTV